jgi:hypothetical protein
MAKRIAEGHSKLEVIFPDPAMTVAAIDRLVHHAIILEMNTASYRRKIAQARVTDFTTNETVPAPPSN